MSYILDALRRADSERDRGAVPDLHAHQVPVAVGDGTSRQGDRLRPWVWVVAALLLTTIGLLVWLLLGREPARNATLAVAPPPAAMTAPLQAATQAVPVAPPVATTAPVVASVPPPVLPPAPVARPAPKPVVKAAAPEVRVYAINELPDDVRRQLPTLAIGGAMYSENAASRMLIINGQLFHERDKLGAGLTLVQIKLKSAVLEFNGYRYAIAF